MEELNLTGAFGAKGHNGATAVLSRAVQPVPKVGRWARELRVTFEERWLSMALVSDRDRATGTLGSGNRWQTLGSSGWRRGPWSSVLGNRPSEAGGQGATGWPDTSRVRQPGCEYWLHLVNTSHRVGQSHHVLGWMEGGGGRGSHQAKTHQGAQARIRVWDKGTRPGGRSRTSWAGSVVPGLGEPADAQAFGECRQLGHRGSYTPDLIFVKATCTPLPAPPQAVEQRTAELAERWLDSQLVSTWP